MAMLVFVESLSLESGAALVAGIAAVAAYVVSLCTRGKLAWLLVSLTSLAITVCLYWFPAWSGRDSFGYATWAPLFIVPWFMAGASASSAVLSMQSFWRKRKVTHD